MSQQQQTNLNFIEKQMYEAIANLSQAEQAELRALSDCALKSTRALTEFTQELQQRFPKYANYITEEAVKHVLVYDQQQQAQAPTNAQVPSVNQSAPPAQPAKPTIPASQPVPQPPTLVKAKKQRQEMWWVILAKSKTLRFFAVSCEFILFLGGLWITFTVNDPTSKTWLGGNVNMIFLTIMGWAVDAAMPEAWLHVVIQQVEKKRGQLSWSKFVAICISLLFIGNIVYSVFTGGDKTGGVSGTPADITGWVLLVLTILRIAIGFVYITVRQCQEWIDRQNPEQPAPLLWIHRNW